MELTARAVTLQLDLDRTGGMGQVPERQRSGGMGRGDGATTRSARGMN